jgi:hypothetical protein
MKGCRATAGQRPKTPGRVTGRGGREMALKS